MISQNIPNIITSLRIVASPLIWVLLIFSSNTIFSFFIWIVCALSDILDGKIARMYRLESNIGAYLDQLADKIFINGSLITLIYIGNINSINIVSVIIIIMRDIIMLIHRKSSKSTYVSYYGKLKTFIQSIAISLIILQIDPFCILLWIASLLSVQSMIDYIYNKTRHIN